MLARAIAMSLEEKSSAIEEEVLANVLALSMTKMFAKSN